MNPKKCIVCVKVKGKRVCRLKANTLICSQCCAQIRNPDCQGCPYYSQAQHYAARKAQTSKNSSFIMRVDPEVDEAVDQALRMIESGNRIGGESIIIDLYQKYPDLHIVQYAMGVAQAMKEEYDQSIEHFNKATDLFPYFVEAWFNKGVSYQRLMKAEDAIRAFQKVIEFGDPSDESVRYANTFVIDIERHLRENDGITLDDYLEAKDHFDAAFSIMEQQHWQQAIDGFQTASALNPNHPQPHGNLGICYARLGRKQEALAAFDKALEIDPNYEPALLNRAIVASLGEGEKLPDGHFKSVEYYKDYTLKKRSMLAQLAGALQK